MADLFDAMSTPTSPLENVDLSAGVAQSNPNNQTADRTARLAAIVTPGSAGQTIDDTTAAIKDEISKYGDQNIRNQVAIQTASDKVKSFQQYWQQNNAETDPDGSLRQGALLASQAQLSEDMNSRSQYALEEEAVNKIQDMAGSDPTQAELLRHNFIDGNTNQVIRDFSAKQLILQREIENAGTAENDQGWMGSLADFALGIVQSTPLTRGDIGNVDTTSVTKNWYDSLFAGERKQAEAGSLWNMPISEFGPYVKDKLIPSIKNSSSIFGFDNKSLDVATLSQFQRPGSVVNANLGDLVNNIGLVTMVGKPLKAIVSLPSLMVRQGARDAAVGLISNALTTATMEGTEAAAAKSGLSKADLMRGISPTALNLEGVSTSTVPVAADTNLAYARGQALMESIPDLQQPGRFMNDAERADALDKNVADIKAQFDANAWVKDVTPTTETLSNGQEVSHLLVTLGKKDFGGFGTEEEVEGFARSLGFNPSEAVPVPAYERAGLVGDDLQMSTLDWESLTDDSGQKFMQVKMPMRETGFYSNPLAPQASNILSRFFLNARKVSDVWLQDLAQVAGNTRQRIGTALTGKLKNINSLNQNELSSLGQVLQYGINNQVWLRDDELAVVYRRAFNREASAKEISAYHDYQDLNDMEFALRNDTKWSQLHLKGYRSVSISTQETGIEKANAIIDRKMSTPPNERVYDTIDKKHYTAADPLTVEKLDDARAKGAVMVKLENPTKLPDGTTVKNFLVRPQDMDEQALVRTQLGYSPGGHRMYSGDWFVKQAREITQPDTKATQLVNPNTFINAETTQDAKIWASKMETARGLINSGAIARSGLNEEAVLDKLFAGDKGFPSGKEFMVGTRDGTYSLDHPFEVVYDRKLPSAYTEANANLEFVDPDRSGQNGLMETRGKMYYSSKGEQLKDFRGELAPTLDPYKTLNQSLQNISKLTSFADYKQAAVERWSTTFRKYTNLPSESSDWKVFTNGNLGRDIPENIRQGALAQRDVINRILGHQSEFDYQTQQFYNKISDWAAGSEKNNARNLLAKSVNWWATKDVSASVRGLVFDAKLGFWNPVQVPIHLGNMYAALTLGGARDGMAALLTQWHTKAFLTKAGTEEMLDHFTSTGIWQKMGFTSANDMKNYMRYVKSSGMMNIGDSSALINEFGPSASISAFSNGQERLRESGRALLHWTWEKNKLVASSLAWQDTKRSLPNLATDSKEFLNAFAGRTEEFDLNFSRESKAAWQKGWTSIPTQFFGYWTALVDASLGKQFTAAQKTRLVLGQLLLGGSVGMPVLSAVDAFYTQETGEGAHPSTFWGNLRRGALDDIIYHSTGADVKAGARLGLGDEFTDMVEAVFGFGENGDKSIADVFGGASASVVKSFGQTISDLVKHTAMESGGDAGPIARDDLIRVASQINTLGNVTKALSIFKYGTIKSAAGNVMAQDVPTAEGWAQLIGFDPEEKSYINDMMEYQKDNSQVVKDYTKLVQGYRDRFATEPDNREDISAEINAAMRIMPPDVRLKVLKNVNRSKDNSLYKSIGDAVKRDLAQKQLIDDVQQGYEQ